MSTELAKLNVSEVLKITEKELQLAQNLDEIVRAAMSVPVTNGFEKALVSTKAITAISELMDEDYVNTIMKLQGKKIGFLTDEDRNSGYSAKKVKEIVIEAVLTGLQPINNQFNIISSKMYPTGEGYTALLGRIDGLWKKIIPHTPRKDGDDTVVDVDVEWKTREMAEKKKESLTFPVKKNEGMGSDAIIGKAKRKAKQWLYLEITGNDYGDGDVTEINYELGKDNKKEDAPKEKEDRNKNVTEAEVVSEEKEVVIPEVELARGNKHLEGAKDLAGLDKKLNEIQKKFPTFPLDKYNELKAKLA